MSKKLSTFSPTPAPDANYTSRLKGVVGGVRTAIGRSVLRVMQLGGIVQQVQTKEGEKESVSLDSEHCKRFLENAENAFASIASNEQQPQEAQKKYQEMLKNAREDLGSTESRAAMLEVYSVLKTLRDSSRTPKEGCALCTTAIRTFPTELHGASRKELESKKKAA